MLLRHQTGTGMVEMTKAYSPRHTDTAEISPPIGLGEKTERPDLPTESRVNPSVSCSACLVPNVLERLGLWAESLQNTPRRSCSDVGSSLE
jgi:hypothetical protein